ncbi:TPA: hypothetical protein ACRF39_005449, partial [Escherichia coli]
LGLSAACRPQNAFGIQPQAPAAILIVFLSATILFMPLYFLYPEQENTRELSHPNASGFPSTGFVLLTQNAKCLK